MKTTAAIILAVSLTLSGAAQAAGSHNGGGGGHFGGGAAAHGGGGGGHFGGHGGGHGGGHFGGHRGYGYGYGYGALGFGLGLGLGTYYGSYPVYDDDAPVPYDYHGDYPDDSAPPPDAGGYGTPPDVPGTWYHCDSPDGYYPYVGICAHPWQAVPAIPPPPSSGSKD